MVLDTVELYERLLNRLPLSALRESCNGEVKSEIDRTAARLAKLMEAFGRMKEVTAAVAKVQEDKGDRRRSASLMALLAEVESLNQRLSKEMKHEKRTLSSDLTNTAAAEAVDEVTSRRSRRKRAPVPVVPPSQTASGSDTESDDGESASHGSEASATQVPGEKTTLELAQTCLHSLSKKSLTEKTLMLQCVGTAKLVVKRLAEGEDENDAVVQVAEALLDGIVRRLADVRHPNASRLQTLVDSISEACSTRPSLRSHLFRAQAQLESMLLESTNHQSYYRDPSKLAREVDLLHRSDKLARIPEVMDSIRCVFAESTADQAAGKTGGAMKLLAGWIEELPAKKLAASLDLDACKSFCEVMLREADKLRNPHPQKRSLAKFAKRLSVAFNEAGDGSANDTVYSSSVEGAVVPDDDAGVGSREALQPAVELAQRLGKMKSWKARQARLPELMDVLEDVLPTIPDASVMVCMGPLMHVMQELVPLATEAPIDPLQTPRYEQFCKAATQFSHRISDSSTRYEFYRQVELVLRNARDTTTKAGKAASASASLSSKRASKDAVASISASDTISEAIEQISSWEGGIFSLQQIDKVIKSIDGIMEAHRPNSAWDPRMDERVSDCVWQLRDYVDSIKKPEHRTKRLGIVDGWYNNSKRREARRSGGGGDSKSGKSSKKRKL